MRAAAVGTLPAVTATNRARPVYRRHDTIA
jgi:hypothetical protein